MQQPVRFLFPKSLQEVEVGFTPPSIQILNLFKDGKYKKIDCNHL